MLYELRRGLIQDVNWTDYNIFAVKVIRNSQNHLELLVLTEVKFQKRRTQSKALYLKSLIVCAGLTAEAKKAPLAFIQKSVKINAEVYRNKVYKKVLLPWINSNFNNRQMILQQDWAVLNAFYPIS